MFGLCLSVSAVMGTIGIGVYMHRRKYRGSKVMFACIAAASFCLLLAGALFTLFSAPALAAEAPAAVTSEASSSNGLGFIGMALSTGLACVGAGVALGSVGSAALGLLGEQPDAIGRTLIYVGLAESVAIYGVVISILIFTKLA